MSVAELHVEAPKGFIDIRNMGVTFGSDGVRNITLENSRRRGGVRRIRCARIGSAMASAPSRYSGVRKLMPMANRRHDVEPRIVHSTNCAVRRKAQRARATPSSAEAGRRL